MNTDPNHCLKLEWSSFNWKCNPSISKGSATNGTKLESEKNIVNEKKINFNFFRITLYLQDLISMLVLKKVRPGCAPFVSLSRSNFLGKQPTWEIGAGRWRPVVLGRSRLFFSLLLPLVLDFQPVVPLHVFDKASRVPEKQAALRAIFPYNFEWCGIKCGTLPRHSYCITA